MDLDSFLATPKWDILKIISKRPSSPIEIAEITQTTVSYVSQQLKLLEAIGIVKKKKTGAFLKGVPRNVYSLVERFVYFSVLTDGFAEKKKLALLPMNEIVLRIWLLENKVLHVPLQKFFLFLEDHLPEIDAVFLNSSTSGEISLSIVSDKKNLLQELNLLIKKINEKISFSIYSGENFSRNDLESFYVLYEKENILKTERKEMKGGLE